MLFSFFSRALAVYFLGLLIEVYHLVGGPCRVFDGGVFCASACKITGRRSIRSSAGITVARAANPKP